MNTPFVLIYFSVLLMMLRRIMLSLSSIIPARALPSDLIYWMSLLTFLAYKSMTTRREHKNGFRNRFRFVIEVIDLGGDMSEYLL